ncbi:hypothetical protein [Allonocardiopsis opalescens]|uniref:Polymer-forming protein n=1 Tax=Allonocardiopsis opalescens TaxID=1144618 RepID=A0A2T0QCZ2_9ACTN|nr:hypothetical protein [Allonocardiopsis opalescens]PRY01723.1 hypothetical protein CLV72_101307 [Allonocardiopsis opalescens]
MRRRTTIVTAAMLAASGFAFAAPASADLDTRCIGTAGAVTVPGDLFVPAGRSCDLTGTTIQGDVRVQAGADLLITGGTIEGAVTVQQDGYFDAVETAVGGAVTLRAGFGAYLESSEFAGNVRSVTVDGAAVEGFLISDGSAVGGNLDARTGDLFAESSTVGGNLIADGTVYADVFDVVVEGNLTVRNGNEYGSVVCGSEVYGNGTFSANTGALQIGAATPLAECDATSYWNRSVTVTGNTGGVTIDQNIIRNNLTATGNDPVAAVGSDNRVRGEIIGDTTPLRGSMTGVRALRATADRDAAALADAETRRTDAEAAAAQAGPAAL